jgi:predicted ester cyclase
MPTLNQHHQTLLGNFMQDVWSNGDVERCEVYIAETYTIHPDPGDPWDGQSLELAGFKTRVRLSRAPFPDQKFQILEMFADKMKVIVTWNWMATHVGDLPNFPATGKSMSMSVATVYCFNDAAKITGHWQVADGLGIYQQLQQARRV